MRAISINYLEFFCMQNFFFYLSNHLLKALWTHEYLFYTLGYIQYYYIFFVQIVPAALGALSVDSYILMIYPHCIGVFCFCFCSFISGTATYSRFILYTVCYRPRISHFSKESCFFLLESTIKNQDLGSRCAHC